jgi:ribosomal protein L14E/L6E/L27E
MRRTDELVIGQIVRVTRGRDSDTFAVVVDKVDDRYILIADGKYRRFEKPKRKNILHVEPTDTVAHEISSSIAESGRISNAKIRYAIESFLKNNFTEEQLKGERAFGKRRND